MICKIAGLGVDVPPVGDLPARCLPYLADVSTDIFLDREEMDPERWDNESPEMNYYLQSGFQFYRKLMDYDGLMLHSSCVVVEGYAYLFCGPCGIGKSTHTAKYLKAFPGAVIINDDKPALRLVDGRWIAFGTPWCGKDGINRNTSAPIAGICILHRGETKLNRLGLLEAAGYLLLQTNGRKTPEQARKLMRLINAIVEKIPVFEFYNHADEGAERITYAAMRSAMEQMENVK